MAMRILSVLASPAPGGAEMLVQNLSAEFAARGHSPHVLFLSDAAGVGNPPEFEPIFLNGLESVGVSHEIMASGSFHNPWRGGRQLRRAVQSFRPDVMHLHLGRALLCSFLSGIKMPTVYTHHSVVANFPPLLFKLLAPRVDEYVAIGGATRRFLEEHVKGPIRDIPNGVPARFSRAAPRRGFSTDPLILSVGSLRPVKDIAAFVEAAAIAFPRFAAQGRKVRFAVAGEGSERLRLQDLIERSGLNGSFELLGARSDVADLMQQADLLVNSSLHEGLPVALIEAAMSGLPIIATNVGGNPEVVLDKRTGLIVPPRAPEALAEAMVSLLSDRSRYITYSEAALDHAKGYTITKCADAHLDLYQSLL